MFIAASGKLAAYSTRIFMSRGEYELNQHSIKYLAGKYASLSANERLCIVIGERKYTRKTATLGLDIADHFIFVRGPYKVLEENHFMRQSTEKLFPTNTGNSLPRSFGNRFVLINSKPLTLIEMRGREVIRIWTYDDSDIGVALKVLLEGYNGAYFRER